MPYERVNSTLFPGIEVWIRRDDTLDPLISGNKAYKLLYNLLEAKARGLDAVITCGGAWSNHIHATAAAGARFGFKTVGIVRGWRPKELSAALQDAERLGMQLVFVKKSLYHRRWEEGFLEEVLGENYKSALFIPEGGSSWAGVKGAELLGRVIKESASVNFDQVWVACGTGATFAGLVGGLRDIPVIGVEVLSAGDSIANSVDRWLTMSGESISGALYRTSVEECLKGDLIGVEGSGLLSGGHCGGYAKCPKELSSFLIRVERDTGIPVEPVYTGKLLHALSVSAKSGRIPAASKVLVVHSGGLQGRRGYM
ncbi:1-aminocyclopropane-1-carboxylate deaminase/D-cysteine desulfhydrase [Microbulbifer sp. EKSA005]|uniref:1-aminocyclopropane-1-carboxylate deaminase/D-cysteine desulfhydrase n=1 Tax=Microbulbifer sp. EKSA005 TaxID=3243364 RepID=UPI004042EB46